VEAGSPILLGGRKSLIKLARNMKMDTSRAKRYKDKINIIIKRCGQIEEWQQELDLPIAPENEKTKLAIYKAFQDVVEASMDIVAMMLKDSKIGPKDDYSNIDLLELNADMKAILAQANGLRNRLVHRYNNTDDLIALECMNTLLPGMQSFVEDVEQWMRKKLKEE
jgi:uncharacterized protein YutE (UPF0331/DUF86 family)